MSHGVQFHQYADDTQLRLAVSSDNTPDGLSVLAACTAEVRQWYLQNELQLNPEKSEALVIGTANQLRTAKSAITSVCVADVQLPVADEIKVLGVVLDRRLAFDKHVMAVTRSCNFHAQAIRHIRHLLSTDLAQTLAFSLILTRLDYCNSVLYGAPVSSIQKLQRVQNNTTRIVFQAPRRSHAKPLMRQLHWLPVQHRIDYKVSVLTYKTLYKHVCTAVPQPTHQSPRQRTDTTLVGHARHCSSNRSLVPASRNVLFDVPRRSSETHFPRLSSEATHCLYSNLG